MRGGMDGYQASTLRSMENFMHRRAIDRAADTWARMSPMERLSHWDTAAPSTIKESAKQLTNTYHEKLTEMESETDVLETDVLETDVLTRKSWEKRKEAYDTYRRDMLSLMSSVTEGESGPFSLWDTPSHPVLPTPSSEINFISSDMGDVRVSGMFAPVMGGPGGGKGPGVVGDL